MSRSIEDTDIGCGHKGCSTQKEIFKNTGLKHGDYVDFEINGKKYQGRFKVGTTPWICDSYSAAKIYLEFQIGENPGICRDEGLLKELKIKKHRFNFAQFKGTA